MHKASIIIPSLGRTEALDRCLKSIAEQNISHERYEIIIVSEEGPLSRIRNMGAKRASGDILVFIDDDVIATQNWLQAILRTFDDQESVGMVSGPAVIRSEIRSQRDLFRYRFFKWVFDSFFIGRKRRIPAHLSRSGAWTTAACDEATSYNGEVDYAEACNMSILREVFEKVGGFDESYQGVGDWSEPDLAFRVRELGKKIWYCQEAKLYHEVSRSGAFKKRNRDSKNRMNNYLLFSKRWVKPYWKHELFKLFIGGYYAFKSFK